MNWIGDPETDLILSLMDETGVVVLGEVVKDGELSGWNGYDCMIEGERKHVGFFKSAGQAKVAVASVVHGHKLNA